MMYLTVLAAHVLLGQLRYQWYIGTVFYVNLNLPALMIIGLPVAHGQQGWFHWEVAPPRPHLISGIDQLVKK